MRYLAIDIVRERIDCSGGSKRFVSLHIKKQFIIYKTGEPKTVSKSRQQKIIMKPFRKLLFAVVTCAIGITISLQSCKKENPSGPNARSVKYEITGTFSGKLDVVYNDNVNGNTHLTNVSVPWTKEINYGSNIMGIGIGAQASITGVSGQSATIKIYSGGTVVKTSTATAGPSGEILIPAIAYQF